MRHNDILDEAAMTQLTSLPLSRREAVALTLSAAIGAAWPSRPAAAAQAPLITKAIPATGQRLPVIGVGTNSFTESKREELRAVLKRLVELGGSVVDTAPVYGDSELVIGELLAELNIRDRIFLASKLTAGPMNAPPPNIDPGSYGQQSLDRSLERLKTDHLDLLQVHNLQGVEQLWPQLRAWKKSGKIRYIGITTAMPGQHAEMIGLMRKFPVDFVQVDYSIANVPFGGRAGANLMMSQERALPPFAAEWGATDWPQLLLKYVVSQPAVTCTIAGSTKVEHLEDNQAAGRGALPDAAARRRLEQYWDQAA